MFWSCKLHYNIYRSHVTYIHYNASSSLLQFRLYQELINCEKHWFFPGEPSAPKLTGRVGEDGNSFKVILIKQDDGGSPIRHYLVRYRAVSTQWIAWYVHFLWLGVFWFMANVPLGIIIFHWYILCYLFNGLKDKYLNGPCLNSVHFCLPAPIQGFN